LKLKTFYFISCIVVLLSLAVVEAPSFLIVSDQPANSDAVVLFLGGEKGTREKEAHQLLRETYADCLIIPARGQVQKINPDGKLIKIDLPLKPNTLNLKPAATAAWLEDTHEEALIARGIMEGLGINSAILVSAPYHMRRIKMIAESVFGNSPPLEKGGRGDLDSSGGRYRFTFVPTRYEAPGDGVWLLNERDRKFVLTEYTKIAWFLLYSPFV